MKFKKILAFSIALAICIPVATASVINSDTSSIVVSADTITEGDFTFSTRSDGTATLTKYAGTSSDVVIPSKVTTEDGTECLVTTIDAGCFYNNISLVSVTIPNTVVSISPDAIYGTFQDCISLEEVIFEENSSLTTIGSYTFKGCTSLTNIVLPNTVTTLGQASFSGCSSLSKVALSSNLTTIGVQTFANCKYLTEITLPSKLVTIGSSAFNGCKRISSITIPKSVDSVGESAFSNCDKLTSVTIEEGSTCEFDKGVFSDCPSLEEVSIADSIAYLGENMFENCIALTSVVLPMSAISVPSYMFSGCTSLQSVVIPTGVTSIYDYAFCNCTSLISIDIPNTVTTINYAAFENCSSLKSVVIPSSVKSIDSFAFYNCTTLSSVTIPNSVTSVGKGAFLQCTNLYTVTVPNSVTTIGERAFGVTTTGVVVGIICDAKLMEGFSIVGTVDSEAQYYAEDNNITFIDIESGEVPPHPVTPEPSADNFTNGVYCDVNGDGVANIIDLLLVKKYILGM